jgi:hypothetical protein
MIKYFWLLIPLFIFLALLPNFCFASADIPNIDKKVLITEVGYNPPQSGTDTKYEWVEIYNNSGDAIDLTNWSLSDNNSTDKIPAFVLTNKEFLVIAATKEGFLTNFSSIPKNFVYLAENLSSSGGSIGNGLSNSSDLVILKDSSDQIIDKIPWSLDTPNLLVPDGYSIERIPYDGDFKPQRHPSPGMSPVFLESPKNIMKNSMDLCWENNSLNFSKYEIYDIENNKDNLLSTQSADNNGNCITISDLDSSTEYQFFIRVYNDDEFSADSNIIDVKTDFDHSNSIMITEILPEPENGPSNEFIEIYNKGSEIVDLSGWYLDDIIDGGSSPFEIPKGTKILPNQYLVFGKSQTGISLNDRDGDLARLLWPDNTVVFQTPNYGDAKRGMSFMVDSNNKWQWSRTKTPGTKNIFTPQYLPQKINVIKNQVEQVQVLGQIIMAPGDFAQSYFYVSDGSFALKIETSDKLEFSQHQCLLLLGTIKSSKENYLSLDDHTKLTDCSLISSAIFINADNQLLKSLIGRLVKFSGEVYTQNSSYFINYQGQKIKIRSLPKLHKGIGTVQGILGFGTSYYQLFIIDANWFQIEPIITNSPPAKSLVGVDENDASKVILASFGTVKAAAYTPLVDYRGQNPVKNNSDFNFLIFYYFSLIIFSALAKILLFV